MERYPRLRDLREDADLTQAQVGQALHLTQRAYAYYESGQRMLPPQVLCALARYYGVSVDYLLGETDVRALSGGEKAVRDRSAPPETAGFSKPFQPAHPAPPRKKTAAPVGAAVFHPILSWPAAAARGAQVQMHNRWNPELNVQAIPGYTQLLHTSNGRLAERCLWTGRIALPDTWESVTLLCVPLLDSAGNVRGICGAELSDLYFRLTYPAVDSAYGSMVTVLAPIDGDRLLLAQAMIGSPGGSYLTADGTLTFKTGRYYNTYSDGSRTYLGLHEPIGATDAAGRKLAAVTLVPDAGLRALEARSRTTWIIVSLVFLAAMLLLSTYLSRRFVTPISRSLQAIREQTPGEHPSGISEIDELLAFVRSRAAEQLTAGGLPPNIEELLSGFRDRVQTLTSMERTVLQYYIDGCSLEEVAARAYISVATAKKHNTNINRKLGVTSREELMLYIDLFRRCGRLDEIAAPRAEDTARCTT